MAVFKCKICGGQLEITENASVCTCEYCGTEQTLPNLNNDRKVSMYDRANHFRRNNDYDRAMSMYEQILNEDDTDAEAYWSIMLCRYGIEYVEDPVTGKRIPTVNRAQYTSIYADEDYKEAINHASLEQKKIFEKEAKNIDDIQKNILEISRNEEPFDIFICYKETDAQGNRTKDSVIANDLYHQLTREGFKVFFSAITLEGKLGEAYEPYIFAALNSAKVMIVLGTKPEYFLAPWVKNEWGRYLTIIKDNPDKMIIPAYRDMDPYDLPDEFSFLQAQDMSKIGFVNDIIYGIKKVIRKDDANVNSKPDQQVNTQSTQVNTNVQALLDRGFMALEDREWDKADGFFEEVLNQDARNGEAYLGKLLAAKQVSDIEQLVLYYENIYADYGIIEQLPSNDEHISEYAEKYKVDGYLDYDTICEMYDFNLDYHKTMERCEKQKEDVKKILTEDKYISKIKKYGSEELRQNLENVTAEIIEFYENRVKSAASKDEIEIKKLKQSYDEFLNQTDKDVELESKSAKEKQSGDYDKAVHIMNSAKTTDDYNRAKGYFMMLGDYKNSKDLSVKCKNNSVKIEKLEQEYEKKKKELQHEIDALEDECCVMENKLEEDDYSSTGIFFQFIVVVICLLQIIMGIIETFRYNYFSINIPIGTVIIAFIAVLFFLKYERRKKLRLEIEEKRILKRKKEKYPSLEEYISDNMPQHPKEINRKNKSF